MGFLDSVMSVMEESIEKRKKDLKKMIKTKSDDEIIRAIKNAERQGNHTLYQIFCDEAHRRGLL